MKTNKIKKAQNTIKAKLKNGLILATLALLIGCESLPKERKIIPNYSSNLLLCVAQEYEIRYYGDCTKRAIDDWSIIIQE